MSKTKLVVVVCGAAVVTITTMAMGMWVKRKWKREKRREKINEEREEILRNRREEEVEVKVIENEQEWKEIEEEILEVIKGDKIMGMDCEWVKERRVALIQLAVKEGRCFIIRMTKIKIMPKTLVRIMGNDNIIKLGVGIMEDAKKIRDDFGVEVRGCVDLRHISDQLRPNLRRNGLAGQAKAFLNVNMDKDWRIRVSNWEAEQLTKRQINYAANDALVAVYVALVAAMEKYRDNQRVRKEQLPEMCRKTLQF